MGNGGIQRQIPAVCCAVVFTTGACRARAGAHTNEVAGDVPYVQMSHAGVEHELCWMAAPSFQTFCMDHHSVDHHSTTSTHFAGRLEVPGLRLRHCRDLGPALFCGRQRSRGVDDRLGLTRRGGRIASTLTPVNRPSESPGMLAGVPAGACYSLFKQCTYVLLAAAAAANGAAQPMPAVLAALRSLQPCRVRHEGVWGRNTNASGSGDDAIDPYSTDVGAHGEGRAAALCWVGAFKGFLLPSSSFLLPLAAAAWLPADLCLASDTPTCLSVLAPGTVTVPNPCQGGRGGKHIP